MSENIEFLGMWILICTIVAAVGTTAVPVLYAFSPWRSRRLGQLFMLQAVAFAMAIDLTVLFEIWRPINILVLFWVNAVVFTFIASSTSALAIFMWRLNHPSKKKDVR